MAGYYLITVLKEMNMDVPPEIAFRHVEPTEALKSIIQDGIFLYNVTDDFFRRCQTQIFQVSTKNFKNNSILADSSRTGKEWG